MSEEMVLRLGFQYMGESQAKQFISRLSEAQKEAIKAAYGVDDLNVAIEKGTLKQIEYAEAVAKGGEALAAATESTDRYRKASRDAAKMRGDWVSGLEKSTIAVEENTVAINENADASEKLILKQKEEIAALKAQAEATRAAAAAKAKAAKEEVKHVTEAQMNQNLADQVAFQRISSLKNLELAQSHYSKSYLRLNKIASSASPALERVATMGGLGILGGAYESVKTYANINKIVMQSVTQAGLNPKDINYYQQGILKISQETGQSAQDLAEALYRVSSGTAGWNGRTKKNILEITKTVSDLTTLGNIKSGVQQEQAARVVTALVNSGLRDVGKDPTKAAALINAAVGSGDIKMSEMVSAMGRGTLLAAKAHGVSAADAMSWVDLLTSTGTTGSVAGTYVKSGLSQFLTPTAQGEKAYAMIGVDSATLQSLAANKGLGAAVAYFDQHIKTFNPFKNYPKTKGAGGEKGAENQLQMWTANQFPPELLAEWKNGFKGLTGKKLKDAQDAVFSLIATKAFGGSKGFTTMAALLENPQGFANIRAAIAKGSSTEQYKKDVNLAVNTPAAQFNRIKNTVVANLFDIGKTLTPAALALGKFLAGLTSFVTNFKPVLEILLGLIGVAIGSVLKAKTAGLMMKAYPILGNEIGRLDKFMSKIGLGEKWGKVGPEFRKQAELARMDKEEKLGKLYAKFGEDVVAFDEKGVARFVGAVDNLITGGTPGKLSGGGATGPAGAVKGAAKLGEKDISFLQRHVEGGDLAGKRITKTSIAEHYGMDRRSKGVAEIYDRLQSGGYINNSFSSSAMKDIRGAAGAEKAVAEGSRAAAGAEGALARGGGILSKIGGMGGGLVGEMGGMLGSTLGLLTGPVGMGVMAMLPIALPLISSGLRALGASSVITPTTSTAYTGALNQTQLTAKVKADKAKLTSLYAKLQSTGVSGPANEAKRSALIGQISALQTQISSETGTMGGLRTTPGMKTYVKKLTHQKSFFDKYGKSLLSHTRVDNNGDFWGGAQMDYSSAFEHQVNGAVFALTPEKLKQKYGNALPADILAQYKKQYFKSFKGGFQSGGTLTGQQNVEKFGKWFTKYLGNYRTATNANVVAAGGAVNAIDPQFAAQQLFNNQNSGLSYWLNRSKDKKFGTKMSKADAENAYISLQQQSGQAAYQAKVDRAYAANTSIPAAQRAEYARQADRMTAQSQQLAQAATALAKKKGLTADDIKGIGTAMSQAIYQMYQAHGIGASAKDIAGAFQAALTNSAAGLAAIVNQHNSNIIIRNW